MFKMIHCADLHLDSKMTAHLDADKAKERKIELLNTFKRLVQEAVNNDVTVIMIAGDLFDTSRVSALTRNTILSEIENHPTIDFYYEKGNHDTNNFLDSIETIPSNLHVFSNEWVSYILNKKGEKNIVLTGIEFNDYNFAKMDLKIMNFNGDIIVDNVEQVYSEYYEVSNDKTVSFANRYNDFLVDIRDIEYKFVGDKFYEKYLK